MNREMADPNVDVPPIEENPHDGIHRVLLVADELFRGPDFLAELRSHIGGPEATVEVFVIVPALVEKPLQQEITDTDGALAAAGTRLEAVIAELGKVGISAVGRVGDTDPTVAVGDGLREFPADEVIVVSHPESQRAYAEKDLWNRLKREFRLPISDIEVPRPSGPGAAETAIRVQHEPAKEHTEEEVIRATRNIPPLRPIDSFAAVFGLLGTAVVIVIAGVANFGDTGPIAGSEAALILIALACILVNGVHAVGLLIFQSVRYTGFWESFMARISIGFTAVSIAAALILWLV